MDTDERFKHLASDPRFKNLRKKQRKIQIDDRFKSMFTDERFTLKYSKDKRGRSQKKTSGDDLKRYYSLADEQPGAKTDKKEPVKDEDAEESEESQPDEGEPSATSGDEESQHERTEGDLDEDEHGGSDEEEEDEEVESDSELSTSSDEPESDLDEYDAGIDGDVSKINYEWQPLDADAEKAESITHRLAIQNLDWDHMDVRDIYILVNSIRPPLSVKIFVSEFGKERLAKEESEGPKELIESNKDDEDEEELKQLEAKMRIMQEQKIVGKKFRNNEYEDADEALDPKNEKIRERIRAYQLSRMKYYYAIAEFDSKESAEAVYNELDGIEYEGSSLALDLRFVPDDIDFDSDDLKAMCDKMPDPSSYKAPLFINSALQQTTVKLTWDETDVKRQEKLQRAYTKGELEKDDLEAYLASGTDSDEEEEEEEVDEEDPSNGDGASVATGKSEMRIKKYEMLLKSLEEKEEKKRKVDVDVEWGNFAVDEKNIDEEEDDSDDGDENESQDNESPDESVQLKRKSGLKRRRNKKVDDAGTDDEDLDLLLMDVNPRHKDEFKFDPDDARFEAIYKSGLYNIDPSHPKFKQTEAFKQIAEKKREKRRKTST